MKIRSATNADRETIVNLVRDALNEFNIKIDLFGTEADLLDLEDNYSNAGGEFLICEDENGDTLGSVSIRKETKSICLLGKLYLSRSARGKGLGKALIQAALEAARKKQFTRVKLTTSKRFSRALAIYLKNGFEISSENPTCSCCDYVMCLSLH